MTIWHSGQESSILDYIINGDKTIEGRLNRDKFAQYKPGDIIMFRRDYRDENGVLHDGKPDDASAEIIAIRKYKTFIELCETENYKKVIPYTKSATEAANEYNKFYSAEDQSKFGVLAIEIKFIK